MQVPYGRVGRRWGDFLACRRRRRRRLCSEGRDGGRDRSRDSGGRGRSSDLSTPVFLIPVPVGCPGCLLHFQTTTKDKIQFEPEGATIGWVDSPRTFQQGNWKPPESIGANRQEPYPSHSAEGWRRRSLGDPE